MSEEQQRTSKQAQSNPSTVANVVAGHDAVRQDIELRAYFRYCERGAVPGSALEDWLAAEREVLSAPRSDKATGVGVANDSQDRRGRRQRRLAR